MDEAQFWHITLRQYLTIVRAKQRQLIDNHNELAWLALQLASLQREKRLPKLQKLLMKYPEKRRQTIEEQKRMVAIMVEVYK